MNSNDITFTDMITPMISKQSNPYNKYTGNLGHSYYNIIVTNSDYSSSPPKQLEYTETRTQAILSNPGQYYFSIIRFTIDTPSLPIFIPTMDLNKNANISPNLNVAQPTIYTITLTYTYYDANNKQCKTLVGEQTPINWYPEVPNSIPPVNVASSLSQDNSTTWYYCYSYQYWINLVNQGFTNAFKSLKNTALVNQTPLPTDNPPFMTWNIGEGIAILNTDIGKVDKGGYLTLFTNAHSVIANPQLGTDLSKYGQISIFFNSALNTLFNSFPSTQYGYSSSVNVPFPLTLTDTGEPDSSQLITVPGGNNQLIIYTYGGQTVSQQPVSPFDLNATVPMIQTSQEYSTLPMLNPVAGIVFTSASIPVVPSNAGSPLIYDGSYQIQTGNNAFIIMEITDFATVNSDYRGFINYTPSGQYRMIDLQGNNPLTTLDMQCFWKDRSGVSRPLYLLSGCTCTIKMLFQKRNI